MALRGKNHDHDYPQPVFKKSKLSNEENENDDVIIIESDINSKEDALNNCSLEDHDYQKKNGSKITLRNDLFYTNKTMENLNEFLAHSKEKNSESLLIVNQPNNNIKKKEERILLRKLNNNEVPDRIKKAGKIIVSNLKSTPGDKDIHVIPNDNENTGKLQKIVLRKINLNKNVNSQTIHSSNECGVSVSKVGSTDSKMSVTNQKNIHPSTSNKINLNSAETEFVISDDTEDDEESSENFLLNSPEELLDLWELIMELFEYNTSVIKSLHCNKSRYINRIKSIENRLINEYALNIDEHNEEKMDNNEKLSEILNFIDEIN